MHTIKTEIKLYSYDELNEKAKEKAFNDHFNFLCENPAEYEDEEGNIKYMTFEDYDKEAVEDSINANEYLFFEDGTQAHITHFVGGHKKAGTTEFYFQGKTYVLD